MPRSFLGSISHPLLLLVFATGTPGRACGEVITYRFSGTIDVIGAAPPSAYFPWLSLGAPVTGFVRWETDLVDANPDPTIGAFTSPAGALHLQIGNDPTVGYLASTQALNLRLNRDLGPEFPPDVFSLEARYPLYGVGGSVPASIDTVVFHFEPLVTGDSVPTTLLPLGNNGFVIDLTHYGMDRIPYKVWGSIASLSLIDGPHLWEGIAGGNWTDPQNWQGDAAPNHAGATAVFGGEGVGEAVVTVDAPVALTDLTFDSSSRRYVLAGDATSSLTFLGPSKIHVASGEHEIAAPILGQGWITKTGAGLLALSEGGNVRGSFNVEMGRLSLEKGSLTATRLQTIGSEIEINATASLVVPSEARIATQAGSQSTLMLSGGTWTHNGVYSGYRYIGDRGKATLRIEHGGTMKSSDSYLGYEATGIGEVLISGQDSSWEVGQNNNRFGTLTVGYRGAGSLTLEDGARLWNGETTIAREAGSRGDVLIRGHDSTWTMQSTLIVGGKGPGTLTLDGAVVHGFSTVLGGYQTGEGIVTLSNGAQWTNRHSLVIGSIGQGHLRIEEGSRLEGGGALDHLVIGNFIGSHGEAIVTDAGSNWSATGRIVVGSSGSGLIQVEKGATFETSGSYTFSVGQSRDGVGEVIVAGEGSRWDSVGDVNLGELGASRVTVLDGGWIHHKSNRGRRDGSVEPIFVSMRGRSSEVVVAGSASLWTIDGNLSIQGESSSVIVQEEGRVESWNGFVNHGGTAVLSDTGSEWDVRDQVQVLDGRIEVQNGATLKSSKGLLRRLAPSAGSDPPATVLLSGQGSHWINHETIALGVPSASSLEKTSLAINDGAVLSTAQLLINDTGLLTGSGGTIIGNVVNSGTIAPGNSPGLLTIDGDLTQTAAGRLAFEIAGPQAYDQLVVTGHAALAGTLSLALLDGYAPELGTTFQLFDFSSTAGELALEFPRLGGGLGWDTRELVSNGVIAVAPMSAIPEPHALAMIALLVPLGFAVAVHRKFAFCPLQSETDR